jgi:hypothetical protein
MKVDINNLQVAIEDILREYGDVVYKATEEGLTAAEKVLIKNLKADSPKSPGGGEYAKSWKGKGKKYKLHRYVVNTKTVNVKNSDTIPLSNILEYATKSPHQGQIKRTYESSINQMAAAVVAEIKEEA